MINLSQFSRVILSLSILTFSLPSLAQLAIIQDTDGYTNVRADSSMQSDVLFQVLHGEVFRDDYDSYSPDTTIGWRPVTLSAGPSADNCYHPPGKSGYMHSSRILPLENIKLKLESEISGELVTLKNDSIHIRFKITAVNKQPDTPCLLGTDQGYGHPGNEISSMTININNIVVAIPAEATDFLYAIAPNTIRGHVYKNLILITSGTNSAAGYYQCVWVIKDGRYFKRFVYLGP